MGTRYLLPIMVVVLVLASPAGSQEPEVPLVRASLDATLAADVSMLYDAPEVAAACAQPGQDQAHFTLDPERASFRFQEGQAEAACAEMRWNVTFPQGAQAASVHFQMDRVVEDTSLAVEAPPAIHQQVRVHDGEGQIRAFDAFDPNAAPSLIRPFAMALPLDEPVAALGWFFHDESRVRVDVVSGFAVKASGRAVASTVTAPTLVFEGIPLSPGPLAELDRTEEDGELVRRLALPLVLPADTHGMDVQVTVELAPGYRVLGVDDVQSSPVDLRAENVAGAAFTRLTWQETGGQVHRSLIVESRVALPPPPAPAPPANVAWLAFGLASTPLLPWLWAGTGAARYHRTVDDPSARSSTWWFSVVGLAGGLYALTLLQATFLVGIDVWTQLPIPTSAWIIHIQFLALAAGFSGLGALVRRSAARAQARRLRAALMDQERVMEVLESAPDAMLVVDRTGRITTANRRSEQLFGHPRTRLLDLSIHGLLPRLEDEAPDFRVSAIMAHGAASVPRGPITCLRADGSTFPADLNISPIRTDRGPALVASIRDVADELAAKAQREEMLAALARSNADLEKAIEELARSNADLERFATIASHDLQEPLRKVTSYVTLLENRYREQIDERGQTYIGFAADGARRMQHLVRDLLAYARVGRAGAPVEQVDLAALVRDVIRDLEASIQQSGARVEVGGLPVIDGRAVEVHVLFQNLLANAIKFRSPDRPPRVNVYAERLDGAWSFTVEDNGIGIDPAHHERIFGVFQRLHPRSRYDGTGVGLALCQRIAEEHGGRVTVRSANDEGAAFSVVWPDAQVKDQAP